MESFRRLFTHVMTTIYFMLVSCCLSCVSWGWALLFHALLAFHGSSFLLGVCYFPFLDSCFAFFPSSNRLVSTSAGSAHPSSHLKISLFKISFTAGRLCCSLSFSRSWTFDEHIINVLASSDDSRVHRSQWFCFPWCASLNRVRYM